MHEVYKGLVSDRTFRAMQLCADRFLPSHPWVEEAKLEGFTGKGCCAARELQTLPPDGGPLSSMADVRQALVLVSGLAWRWPNPGYPARSYGSTHIVEMELAAAAARF